MNVKIHRVDRMSGTISDGRGKVIAEVIACRGSGKTESTTLAKTTIDTDSLESGFRISLRSMSSVEPYGEKAVERFLTETCRVVFDILNERYGILANGSIRCQAEEWTSTRLLKEALATPGFKGTLVYIDSASAELCKVPLIVESGS